MASASQDKRDRFPFTILIAGRLGSIYSILLEERLGQTASKFTADNHEGAPFQCPVPPYLKRFNANATLTHLWEHCADIVHEHALYEEDHVRCEMGYEKDFADTLARL